MNLLVFNIKTVPDIDGCRRLYQLHGLSDDDVARAVFHKRRQQFNNEFLPHYLHRIVAISAVLRSVDQFRVWSLGDLQSDEADLLQRFFSGIKRYTPNLVSWNGRSFSLPVIHHRSLQYPVNAELYWEHGSKDSSFRGNNYHTRSHGRHTDLVDVLEASTDNTNVALYEIAGLCGFPGDMGMNSVDSWQSYLDGKLKELRESCETNVLSTYLVYLNFQRNRGHLDQAQYQQECQLVRKTLKISEQPHLQAYEKAWIER